MTRGDGTEPVHLVADVGNTEIVIGLFRPGSLEVVAHWRIGATLRRTVDEFILLLRSLLREYGWRPEQVTRAMVGSVVPGVTDLLRRSFERMLPEGAMILDGGSRLPIRLLVEEPRTVGADRIANTLAASHLYGRDTIVVDLGTATTYDCITARGDFLGGVIAPGILAGEEWLASRTAKLPRVDFRPPAAVIGKRTESCLHSGLFYSAVDGMDGIVRRIIAEWTDGDPWVVATGGFASLIAPHSGTIDRTDPYLTLVGLELAGRHLSGEM